MTKPIAIFNAEDFVAQCRFSSTEATRYYLNGVFVDVVNNRLAATDGHRAGVLVMGKSMYVDKGATNFILSAHLAKQVKAKGREQSWLRCFADRVEVLKFSPNVNVKAAELVDYAGDIESTISAKGAYIDGTFPDYIRIIPDPWKVSGEPANGYNATYAASFADPLSGGKQRFISVIGDGEGGPMLMGNADPRFVGVLMPAHKEGIDTRRAKVAELLGIPEPGS